MERLFSYLVTLLIFSTSFAQTNPVAFVDPFIGTGGHGHTFPGATVPFGMVQLSPDTRLEGWDGCSGYHYSDNIVYGFSHTHLSGTGVSDYGDILVMPNVGETFLNNGADGKEGYRQSFDKDDEIASVGYYETYLKDDKIKVQLTASTRCGFHKYTYPKNEVKKLIVDLAHRDVVTDSYIKQVNDTEIEGYRFSTAWAKDQRTFFVMQFSEPLTEKIKIEEEKNKGKVASCLFGNENSMLEVKVGISFVSIEGARKNLEAEIAKKSFLQVKNEAVGAWKKELSKIEVECNEEEKNCLDNKTKFYSALYHTMIAPNVFMDVDGSYLGTDLKIHTAKDYTHHTIFSLWDTYRAAHPLYTIIDEKRTNDFIQTFLNQYAQGGYLPMWELAANYTGCMIGYHAVPVISDAYMKGIDGYDTQKALTAMLAASTADRLGIPSYIRNGFLSGEAESECVSKTLEYAYDDWTIATMAEKMGNQKVADEYFLRAQNYKNIYDPQSTFMRARLNNQWFSPFDPSEVNFNYTEANAWQYSYYVPQDIEGWIKLIGGEENALKALDNLFKANSATTGRNQADITGLIGQYAHGNEPSHHMAYMYNYLRQPNKTQKIVRQIMDELYSTKPDGYSGNEDCGQMSAWYVLSALGFYPVTPGSVDYVIGSPIFDKATINLENGKVFTVVANNNSKEAKYIQGISKNDKAYNKSFLTHQDITSGSKFVFEMDKKPSYIKLAKPLSKIEGQQIVAVPGFYKGEKAFKTSTTVGLNCATKRAKIYYSIDGGDAQEYKKEFVLDKACMVKVWAEKEGLQNSKTAISKFYLMSEDRTIKLDSKYANHYSAGGDNALIDQIEGGNDFRVGNWQGYEKVDLIATVDLGKKEKVSSISTGFLQDENSWIFMPTQVEYYYSKNGKNFKKLKSLKSKTSPKETGSIIEHFEIKENLKARYIKVVAKNRGFCPEWHKGAGGKCWIFVDEIFVR